MNVCGTNSAMSKGLYLIARKIASRWEYAPEWEGGDPTLPSGQGLPTIPSAAHSVPPPEDGDSSRDGGGRRQRGGGQQQQQQRSGGRGGRDRGSGDLDRYERDSVRGGGRSGGGGDSDRRGDRGSFDHGARDGAGRYGRGGGSGSGGGRDRDGQQSGSGGGRDKAPRGGTIPLQTTSAPWITDQPSAALATALGAAAAAAAAPAAQGSSAVSAAASAEAWQKLLGQIPATARESLGIGTVSASGAADMFGQFASRAGVTSAVPQQLVRVFFLCGVDVSRVAA